MEKGQRFKSELDRQARIEAVMASGPIALSKGDALAGLRRAATATTNMGINDGDIQLYVLRECLGGYYGAPITEAGASPRRILHLGNGRGHWGIEMALIFPQALVLSYAETQVGGNGSADTGMDGPALSAFDLVVRPQNHRWQQGDPFGRLPFADGTFDFVRFHPHTLNAPLSLTGWQAFIAEVARVTRPGGWVEIFEAALPVGGGAALRQVTNWVTQAYGLLGMATEQGGAGSHLTALFSEVGLRRVQSETLWLPIGAQANVRQAFMPSSAVETGVIGMSLSWLLALHCCTLLADAWAQVKGLQLVSFIGYNARLRDARNELAAAPVVDAEADQWLRPVFPISYALGQRPG